MYAMRHAPYVRTSIVRGTAHSFAHIHEHAHIDTHYTCIDTYGGVRTVYANMLHAVLMPGAQLHQWTSHKFVHLLIVVARCGYICNTLSLTHTQ